MRGIATDYRAEEAKLRNFITNTLSSEKRRAKLVGRNQALKVLFNQNLQIPGEGATRAQKAREAEVAGYKMGG